MDGQTDGNDQAMVFKQNNSLGQINDILTYLFFKIIFIKLELFEIFSFIEDHLCNIRGRHLRRNFVWSIHKKTWKSGLNIFMKMNEQLALLIKFAKLLNCQRHITLAKWIYQDLENIYIPLWLMTIWVFVSIIIYNLFLKNHLNLYTGVMSKFRWYLTNNGA